MLRPQSVRVPRRLSPDGGRLSVADRDRLRYAIGSRRVDPGAPLFAPDSLTRRINRHAVLLLGGGRALLMQLAHPLVAAGVAAHSHFDRAPLQRLWRTLDLTLSVVFG
ncbi:MAG: oxygenase MpaB family protein, partial [bacterium]